jgi:hypothetical protein
VPRQSGVLDVFADILLLLGLGIGHQPICHCCKLPTLGSPVVCAMPSKVERDI